MSERPEAEWRPADPVPAVPLGAILAGGRSQRMGTDKALVRVGGVPMVERVAAALRRAAGEVLIIGRSEPLAGISSVPDVRPGRPRGPLPGLAAALRHAVERPVLLVAVDQPLVRSATLQRLAALVDDRPVVPVDRGVRQTTCAAYPAAFAAAADDEDRRGGSIQSLLDDHAYRPVEEDEWASWGEDGRSWFSVDTPAAVAELEERFNVVSRGDTRRR
jgi:molybdopterin-guanine dinucleotide biosynthesis protein A